MFIIRIRNVLGMLAVAGSAVGAGLLTAPEPAEAVGACDFQYCNMGQCDGDTNNPDNCSGEAPCTITACEVHIE